jgi:hypothetical protein
VKASRQVKRSNRSPVNPDTSIPRTNTVALIIQERSTFAHRHLTRHTHCETIQEKIERNLAPFPCTLRTPHKSTVSDKERKSFYVTDDISFGFIYPYREVAASMIPSEKQCQPKHRRKNMQCALKIKPSLWVKHRLLLLKQRVYRYRELRRRCLKEFVV